MPRRKLKSKAKREGSQSSSRFENSEFPDNQSAIISSSKFFDGLTTASSPSNPIFYELEEHKKLYIESINSEAELLKGTISAVFDGIVNELDDLSSCTYSVETSGGMDLYEFVERNLGGATQKKETRKVTWNANINSGSSQSRESSRKPRRSKSEDNLKTSNLNGHSVTRSCSTEDFSRGFKTPCNSRRVALNIATVTPHPRYKDAPTNILRKPEPGETAISMSGSPLYIVSDNATSPRVTVPLVDGRVYHVMPKPGLNEHLNLPDGVGSPTIKKLKMLREYLNKALPD